MMNSSESLEPVAWLAPWMAGAAALLFLLLIVGIVRSIMGGEGIIGGHPTVVMLLLAIAIAAYLSVSLAKSDKSVEQGPAPVTNEIDDYQGIEFNFEQDALEFPTDWTRP